MCSLQAIKGRAAPPVQKIYYFRFAIALVVFALVNILGPLENSSLDALFQTLGGGAYALGSPPFAIPLVILAGIPTLVYCYMFSDYFKTGVSRTAPYVFTRTTKRGLWFLHRLLQLCTFTFVYTLFGSILVILLFLAFKPEEGILASSIVAQGRKGIAFFFFASTFLNTATLLALLIPINVLSLRLDTVISFASTMSLYFACLFVAAFSPAEVASTFIPWLPTTQGVYAWHDIPFTQASRQGVIEGFSLMHSYVYLLIVVGIEAFISKLYIKRLELY